MTPDPKPTEAMKPCPNHPRYTEGCTACFVEAGTSTPDLERDAEAAALREALQRSLDALTDGDTVEPYPYIPAIEAARAALASTAGAGILERLAKAEEERDQARIERDTEQQFLQRSDAKLAAVTAERDAARAIRDQRTNCGACGELRHTPWRDSEHGYVCLSCLGDAMSRLTAAESEIAALRKAIQHAPHGAACLTRSVESLSHRCDCWKASALKGAE